MTGRVCTDSLENICSNYSAILSHLITFLFDKHVNIFYSSSDIFPFLVPESAGKMGMMLNELCEITDCNSNTYIYYR